VSPLGNWVRQDRVDCGEAEGLTSGVCRPILMLTAPSGAQDRVAGLNSGAEGRWCPAG